MEISFCANLKIDSNFGTKTPSKIDKDNLMRVKEEYKKFIEEDKIVNALMKNDTIELSTHNGRDGYSINMDFYEEGKEEPIQIPICISRGSSSQFNFNSLRTMTYYFIALKSGSTPKLSEGFFKFIKRGILTYAENLSKKDE